MAFYSYKKNKTSYSTPVILLDEPVLSAEEVEIKRRKKTFGNVISEQLDRLGHFVKTSKLANVIIPLSCLMIGFAFIYQEFFPKVQQIVREKSGYYSIGNLSPVDDEYINIKEYV